MKGFLYGQTEYTMFNNTIHLDDDIEEARRSGFDFLTITDNNLYGHYKFYNKCIENKNSTNGGRKTQKESRR